MRSQATLLLLIVVGCQQTLPTTIVPIDRDAGAPLLEALDDPTSDEAPGPESTDAYVTAAPTRENLIAFAPYVRSSTWKARDSSGGWCSAAAIADFEREASRMRAAGLNAVWIDDAAVWAFTDPDLDGSLDAAELGCLRQKLAIAARYGLRVLLKINAAGNGFFPQQGNPAQLSALIGMRPSDHATTYDFCTWFDHSAAYAKWVEYSVALLRALEDYHYLTYFIVYTEPGNSDIVTGYGTDGSPIYERCPMNSTEYNRTAPMVRRTFGRYPLDLEAIDPTLRSRVALVFHDDGAINEGWVTQSVIEGSTTYDVVSGSLYATDIASGYTLLNDASDSSISSTLSTRLARFKARHPATPFMLGELGSAACSGATPRDADQARVLRAVANWALGQSPQVGWNYWAWTFEGFDCPSGRGYGLTLQPSLDPTGNGARVKAPVLDVMHEVMSQQFRGKPPALQLRLANVRATPGGPGSSFLVGADYGQRVGCFECRIGSTPCSYLEFGDAPFDTVAYFSCPPAAAGTEITCNTFELPSLSASCQTLGSRALVGRAH